MWLFLHFSLLQNRLIVKINLHGCSSFLHGYFKEVCSLSQRHQLYFHLARRSQHLVHLAHLPLARMLYTHRLARRTYTPSALQSHEHTSSYNHSYIITCTSVSTLAQRSFTILPAKKWQEGSKIMHSVLMVHQVKLNL